MLQILKDTLITITTEVTTEVKQLLNVIKGEMKRKEIQSALKLKNDEHFRLAYLTPALSDGVIEMTQPDSPNSPTQRYRLTAKGRDLTHVVNNV
ncbi:MAG: hypothetical protein GX639_11015 [Fibrobacter sp.]|nr:hypothetical protein [Fibrobacter sp.]